MIARFHYDDETLGRLLHDQPDSDTDEVQAHVETCDACQDQLESLSTGDMSWDDVCQLMKRTDHQGFATPIDASQHSTNVAFLEASEEPHSIGKFGRYEIVEILGRGGMGIVMRGIDSALDRHCAIKVLAPELASSSAARKRFSREARSAAAVVHPHVVPIQTVDEHEGHPYLVMPVVEGHSLQQRIEKNGPLQIVEVVRIAAQVAEGLSAAHSQGLVHRDIKPANVLLENDVERVQITDFGLARAVDDASMTRSGVIAGTPQYMSPEQSHGDTIDHRSDLFSLGSVMYFMLTGRSPFRAETSMGVLNRICNDEPRSLRSINADVPPWLEKIIAKLLEKSPDDRFQSSEELANVLGEYLNALNNPQSDQLSKLIESQPVSKTHRSSSADPPNRFRRLVLAAGFAFLALAGTIFYLQTNKGTLRIESNSDMDVPVRIMSGRETVDQMTVSKEGVTTRLQAGNYVIEVDDADTHIEIKGDQFTLRRGDTWVVSITPVGKFRGEGQEFEKSPMGAPGGMMPGGMMEGGGMPAGGGRIAKPVYQEVPTADAIRKRIQGRWRIDSVMDEGYDDLGRISNSSVAESDTTAIETMPIEIKGDVIGHPGREHIKINWIGPDRRVGAKEGAFAVDFGFDPSTPEHTTPGILWCNGNRLQMCYGSEPYEQPFRPLHMKPGPHVILIELSRIAGGLSATNEVAIENDVSDTKRLWRYFVWDGDSNVAISQQFAAQLELNDDQIVAVNQSLRRAWQSYIEIEKKNTTKFSRLDTGGIVAEIDDPGADLPRLRGQLRSELRSIVTDSMAEAIYSLAVSGEATREQAKFGVDDVRGTGKVVSDTLQRAVELWISGNDIPLVQRGDPVRLQFEGWPAEESAGAFKGEVMTIDPTADSTGNFRILVKADSDDSWPDERYLRPGVSAIGWVTTGASRDARSGGEEHTSSDVSATRSANHEAVPVANGSIRDQVIVKFTLSETATGTGRNKVLAEPTMAVALGKPFTFSAGGDLNVSNGGEAREIGTHVHGTIEKHTGDSFLVVLKIAVGEGLMNADNPATELEETQTLDLRINIRAGEEKQLNCGHSRILKIHLQRNRTPEPVTGGGCAAG